MQLASDRKTKLLVLRGYGCDRFTPYGDISGFDHLIVFTGNQWNEDWEFDEEALDGLSEAKLDELLTLLEGPRARKKKVLSSELVPDSFIVASFIDSTDKVYIANKIIATRNGA